MTDNEILVAVASLQKAQSRLFSELIEKCDDSTCDYKQIKAEYDRQDSILNKQINKLLNQLSDKE